MLVVTAGGKLIGEARDLEFDPEDGRLVSLAIRQGGVLGIGGTTRSVPASELQALGPEFIMVTANALDKPVHPGEDAANRYDESLPERRAA
jgi:sporulation protein YlmC with PRC-barrel domain